MSHSSLGTLRRLRRDLANLTQVQILRKYLTNETSGSLDLHQTELLKEGCVVAVHRTWSDFPPYDLMEIGITTFSQSAKHMPIHIFIQSIYL